MMHQGEKADDFSEWTTSALQVHIQVGEEALSKAKAALDEDRVEAIERVLNAQKEALYLRRKKSGAGPEREERRERREAPPAPTRGSIMDMIEQQFGNVQVDESAERVAESPSRNRSQSEEKDKNPEEKRRPRSRRERMQPRVEDVDTDASVPPVERGTTRKHREGERKERRREAPRAEPERREKEKGKAAPPERGDTPSTYASKRGERPDTQSERNGKDEKIGSALPERNDTPPFLEKRAGGGYHRRPAFKFAREDLRPFSAPQSPLVSDDGRDGPPESRSRPGSPARARSDDGRGGVSGTRTRPSAKAPHDGGRNEASGDTPRPGGAYHRRPDAKFAREDLRAPGRGPRSPFPSDDRRDEASGSKTRSPVRDHLDGGRDEAPRDQTRSSAKRDSDGGRDEASGSRTKSSAKKSSKSRSGVAEKDPFANFPLHIRPVFNTTYHPS